MANADTARQNRGYGGQTQDGGNSNSLLDKMRSLSMAALAGGASPSTMAGFALGKLIASYMDRGAQKKKAANDSKVLGTLEGTTGNTAYNSDEYSPTYTISLDNPTGNMSSENSREGAQANGGYRGQDVGGSVVDGTTSIPAQSNNGYAQLANYLYSNGNNNYDIAAGLANLSNGNTEAVDLAVLGKPGEIGYNVATGKTEYIPMTKGLLNELGNVQLKYSK